MSDIPFFAIALVVGGCGFLFGFNVGICSEQIRWLKLLKDSNLKLTKGQKPKDKIEPMEEKESERRNRIKRR